MSLSELLSPDTTYRVSIDPTTGYIDVMCFGIGEAGTRLEGVYTEVESLPKWMQDKLTVLRILHEPPPVCDVPGVGRRMGTNLYWVYQE